MGHEIVVHLTDDDYLALAAEAQRSSQELGDLIQDPLGEIIARRVQDLLEEIIARRVQSSRERNQQHTKEEISELLYEKGVTERIPSGEALSAEEETELKRLAGLFGQAGGKSAAEMVIEDRGPY